MTYYDCIRDVDRILPNAYENEDKIRWIREIEGRVYSELFLMQPTGFHVDNMNELYHKELTLPAPYNKVYRHYLEAMIHYANAEPDRYNMAMTLFNDAWHELCVLFGQDFDVSDFHRNPLVRSEINLEDSEPAVRLLEYLALGATLYLVMRIPEYCSLAGGQIMFQSPDFVGATLSMTVGTSQYRNEISSVTPRKYYRIPMLTAPSGGDVLTIGLSYDNVYPIKSEERSLEPSQSEWEAGMERRVKFIGRLLVPDMVFQRWGYVTVPALEVAQAEAADQEDK